MLRRPQAVRSLSEGGREPTNTNQLIGEPAAAFRGGERGVTRRLELRGGAVREKRFRWGVSLGAGSDRALRPPRPRPLGSVISVHRRDTHQLLQSARTAGTSGER